MRLNRIHGLEAGGDHTLPFEVEPVDLPTYAVVVIGAIAAAAAASYLPARGATPIHAVESLLAE